MQRWLQFVGELWAAQDLFRQVFSNMVLWLTIVGMSLTPAFQTDGPLRGPDEGMVAFLPQNFSAASSLGHSSTVSPVYELSKFDS